VVKRRAIGLLALAALPACASSGGLLGSRPYGGPLPPNAALHAAVNQARARFDSAAQRGDAAALARLLTDDAVVIVGRDTLRGWGAVAGYYNLSRPSAVGGTIEFRPNETVLCTDGAYEIGGSLLLVTRLRNGAADTLQPNYVVRWVVDPSGSARMLAATLQSQAIARSISAAGGCQTYLALARFPRKRFLLTLASPAIGISRTHALASLQPPFVAAGYTLPGQHQYPVKELLAIGVPVLEAKLEDQASLIGGALRVRGPGPLTVEVTASIAPDKVTLTGYQSSTGSHVDLELSQRTLALLLGVEWRRFRAMAGPVLLRASWSLRERRLIYYPDMGWAGAIRTDASWSSNATGLMAEAAWTWPFSSALFAEIRGSWRSAKVDFASPTTVVPSARGLDAGGYSFALALGVAP
jgi:ketosteroid isomerase-like protein